MPLPAVAAAGAAYWWSGSGTKDGSTAKDEQPDPDDEKPADPPQEEDERYLVFEGAAEVDEAQAPAPDRRELGANAFDGAPEPKYWIE